MTETSFNYQPNRQRCFEFFDGLDSLLAEQDALNEELKEALDKNWLDDPDVEEAELFWNAYKMVFHKDE